MYSSQSSPSGTRIATQSTDVSVRAALPLQIEAENVFLEGISRRAIRDDNARVNHVGRNSAVRHSRPNCSLCSTRAAIAGIRSGAVRSLT